MAFGMVLVLIQEFYCTFHLWLLLSLWSWCEGIILSLAHCMKWYSLFILVMFCTTILYHDDRWSNWHIQSICGSFQLYKIVLIKNGQFCTWNIHVLYQKILKEISVLCNMLSVFDLKINCTKAHLCRNSWKETKSKLCSDLIKVMTWTWQRSCGKTWN